MSILEMARIDEKSLTKALLKSSGHDVAHVLAHLWASLKLKEIKANGGYK
jgi:hypothetical protein